MAFLLGIETSGNLCSVALFRDGELIDDKEIQEESAHSKKITLLIERILIQNQLNKKDLNAIAISIGPGSYTGLRIGLSTAKGLCYGLDLPIIAVSTLRIMVEEAISLKDNYRQYLPMMDARRMEIYGGIFDKNGSIILQEGAYILSENPFEKTLTKETLCFGNGAEKWDWQKDYPENFLKNILPRAKFMGKLAYNQFLNNEFADLVLLEPNYLKEYQGK